MFLPPAVAVVAVGAWAGLRSTHSASTTTTAQATERLVAASIGTIRQSVTATGTIKPADTEDLSFAVSGKVTAVNVAAGQKVTKGTVLASVDSAALQSQVAQAQATVDTARARLATDTTNKATAAQLTADQATLDASLAQLAAAQSALAGAALTSPIDGTVSLVNLTVGQQLGSSGASGVALSGSSTGSGRTGAATASSTGTASGTGSSATSSNPQVEVVTTGSFVVNLSVDDTQVGRLAVGQKATVTPAALTGAIGRGRGGFGGAGGGAPGGVAAVPTTTAPRTATPATAATGTVTSVSTIASTTSGVASFAVVVAIDGSPAGFYSGATADVAVTYNEVADVLEIPTAAISAAGGQNIVTVSAAGHKAKRTITTGVSSAGVTEVTSGLQEGDEVVVAVRASTARGGTTGNRTGAGTGAGTGGVVGGTGGTGRARPGAPGD